MKISRVLYHLSLVLALLVVGSNLAIGQEAATAEAVDETAADEAQETPAAEPVQSGPLIDLLGTKLQSLEIVDQTSAQVKEHYTNEALAGKKVIGLYFSADWCVVFLSFVPVPSRAHAKRDSAPGVPEHAVLHFRSCCLPFSQFY